MAKFNSTKKPAPTVINRAGGQAYKQTDKLKLASILLTSMLKDQFYRTESQTLKEIKELIDTVDPLFCAKVAIYARKEYGMRSVSHVVAGELAQKIAGQSWAREFYYQIVNRPDDILEILSYYQTISGKAKVRPTWGMKAGFGRALKEMDEYKLGKYARNNAELKLLDSVNILHPQGNRALKKLMKGTLKAPETFETKLSEAGKSENVEEAKDEAWKDLLESGKIGYFALLRNLRNIVQQSPESIDRACELLVDAGLIKKSLVLPFRFLSALKALSEITFKDASTPRKLISAINKAIEISLDNVPLFEGKTLIALDDSSSMGHGVDQPWGIGSLFASVIYKRNPDAEIIMFSSTARYITSINPDDSIFTIGKELEKYRTSQGTSLNDVFVKANKAYDRVIVLSDQQNWMGHYTPKAEFAQYKVKYNADPAIFSFDLQGLGTLQFPERNCYCLAGFSDKTMDILTMLDGGNRNALVDEIEKIQL